MQKIMLLFTFILFTSTAPAGFNSKGLGGEKQNRPSSQNSVQPPKAKSNTNKRNVQDEEIKNAATNTKKFKDELEGINLVMDSQLPELKRAVLHTKKAFALLNLARAIGINRKSLKEMTKKEQAYLIEAEKSCNEAIELGKDRKDIQSTAYYLLGLAEFEFDKFDSSQQYLIRSLQLDDRKAQSGAVALMIAEHYFETEKFKEAVSYYQSYSKKLTDAQRALADYKTAWAYIGMGDHLSAERYFVKVFQNKNDKSFFDESLRDIAFVATQHRTDAQIIQFASSIFLAAPIRSKYLSQIIKYIINGDLKIPKQNLIEEYFKIETDPQQRIQILSLILNRTRKDFADFATLGIVYKINTEVKKSKIDLKSKNYELTGQDIELEVENQIRVFSETYAGKMRLPPNTSHEKVGEALLYLINWDLEQFPKSSKKAILYELLLDLCIDKKSLDCLERTKIRMDADKTASAGMKSVSTRLRMESLTLLDELFGKDPENYSEKYFGMANDFINSDPQNPKWMEVSKRIAQQHLQKEDFTAAEPLYEKIYAREKNAENFYRLIFCYFKNKKIEQVNVHPDIEKFNDPNIISLKREIYLLLASEKSQSGDLTKYVENIKLFLKSKPEPKKAALAYADLYNKLLEKNDLNFFEKEWGTFDSEIGSQAELDPIRLKAYSALLTAGRIPPISRLHSAETKNRDLFFINAVASLLDRSGVHWQTDLAKLPEQRRTYLLGLLMLTEPEKVISYFQKTALQTDADKQLLYLSYQMRDNSESPQISPNDKIKLKSLIPIEPDNSESALSLELRTLNYPDATKKTAQYERDIELLVGKTKKYRKRSLSELAKLSDQSKARTLELLAAHELKIAEAIKNSPRPANLTVEQSEEYTRGLAELAQEYINQGQEFSKIQAVLVEKSNNEELAKQQNRIPAIDTNQWLWPEGKQKDQVLKFKDCFEGFCGLLYLDHQLNNKALTENDYYKLKGGFLFSLRNSQILRNYFQNELRTAKQNALLEEWRKRAQSK
jgi:hypothetical protein